MSEEVHAGPGLTDSSRSLLLIPAIDLLGGRCVRLLRGSYQRVSHYAGDPVDAARSFEAAGARRLHIVDLDGARRGAGGRPGAFPSSSVNRQVIRRIRAAVRCPLQVGGGVRTLGDVEALLQAGADQLIVGTALVDSPETVAGWCGRYGPLVFLAGIDAREGRVRVRGWEEPAAVRDVELAARAQELGLAGIVYTSISRDGTLAGPDIGSTNHLAASSQLPVILSGGIGSAADLHRVALERHPRVCGVVLGKALYEGAIDLRELLQSAELQAEGPPAGPGADPFGPPGPASR